MGTAWFLLQNASGRATALVSQIILAGLLQPSDFGVVALAISITTLIGTFVAFGIEEVLLSRRRKIRFWVTPALWLSLGLALLGTLVTLVAAPLGAMIYKNPEISRLIVILAFSVPFTAASIVPGVVLQAALKFRFLAVYAAVELTSIQLLTVILAFTGFGAYSFVIPVPIGAAIKAIVFWRAANMRLQWRVHPALWKYLLSSGLTVFGQRLFTEARNNADRIVLGLLQNSTVVGLYFFALKLAAVPVYTLIGSFYRVLLSTFAHLRADPTRQLAAVLSASRLVAVVVLPLSCLQAALARPLLHLLFADRWMGSVVPMQILSIALALDVLPCVAGSLASANGRFRFQLAWTALPLPGFILAVGVGGLLGSAAGVAWGVAVFFVVFAPAYTYFALRPFGSSFATVLEIYRLPALCSLLTIGPAAVLLPYLHANDVVEIAAVTLWSGTTYPLLIYLTSPAIVGEIRTRVAGSFFAGP
ncbi:MAG: oligosaccharide flippase family protein [Xanthobacteraceae bacterium]